MEIMWQIFYIASEEAMALCKDITKQIILVWNQEKSSKH